MHIQLFCMAHAGGNVAFYSDLKQYINDEIEIVFVEYRGHT
ncbi:hypothetical protein [Clostridium felsineum]|nr:hypothetical protein [Clostridium felsineum]